MFGRVYRFSDPTTDIGDPADCPSEPNLGQFASLRQQFDSLTMTAKRLLRRTPEENLCPKTTEIGFVGERCVAGFGFRS
jgi:hypothetical protein